MGSALERCRFTETAYTRAHEMSERWPEDIQLHNWILP